MYTSELSSVGVESFSRSGMVPPKHLPVNYSRPLSILRTFKSPDYPKTDISSLPFELHGEILEALENWSDILTASQVCQSWRYYLEERKDIRSLYEEVHLYEPISKQHGDFHHRQEFFFGANPPVLTRTHDFGASTVEKPVLDHKRHLLFQDCTIKYRRNGVGKPEIKIHHGKKLGYFDLHKLVYYHRGITVAQFHSFNYLSMLSSPMIIDDRLLSQKTRVSFEMERVCSKIKLTTMTFNWTYKTLGQILDLILEKYSDCFRLKCHICYTKLGKEKAVLEWLQRTGSHMIVEGEIEAKLDRDHARQAALMQLEGRDLKTGPGAGVPFTIDDYDRFQKNCEEFGVVIQEQKNKRKAGTMVFRVSPAEYW